jgi:nucleoside-diphosphate-sugar epimerase
MTHITFGILGVHPLLQHIRDHLIVERKLQLVPVQDGPDFVVVGAEKTGVNLLVDLPGLLCELQGVPTHTPLLVLSSGHVYSDRDANLQVSEEHLMAEERPVILPSPLDTRTQDTLLTTAVETAALQYFKHVLVLRVFEVYGSTIPGTIQDMIGSARQQKALRVATPGYQIRTYLHVDDFMVALDSLLPKFLRGARGIYNIGSTEEISLKRLAESIWQLTNPGDSTIPMEMTHPPGTTRWWAVPDITRLQVLLNWKPKITVRKGLWFLLTTGQGYEALPNQ